MQWKRRVCKWQWRVQPRRRGEQNELEFGQMKLEFGQGMTYQDESRPGKWRRDD